MRQKKICTKTLYFNLQTSFYQKLLGKLYLKNSEIFYNSALSLPIYPTLKLNEQDFIIAKLNQILKKFNEFKA